MEDRLAEIWKGVASELDCIWQAHARVGLDGFMCLYAVDGEDPWRSQHPGVQFWFGPADTEAAIEQIRSVYNNGERPNTTLLLNPIVHEKKGNKYQPLGSGIVWATGLARGVATLSTDQKERISSLGVAVSSIERGDNPNAGLKMLAFSEVVLKPQADGAIPGCRALYDIADTDSEEYWSYYLLSGLSYLSKNGSFAHPAFAGLFKEGEANPLGTHTVALQKMLDAQECWNAYDRHHSLYRKFGVDMPNLERNLEFYNLCARDFELFDATGPMKDSTGGAGEFQFVVEGLVPRGSIILLSGTGGTGKSSLAHLLCVLAATDWREDEQPMWLGQPVNKEHCKGICVYFSGEDGPAIINSRQALYDPEGRAHRVMFQRTEFRTPEGEEAKFPEFMKRLHAMPDVPVMVIDPARKYLTGDEDDAGVVSEFFEAIEEFAIRKNAAVIVVHHLAKGAKPQSAADVVDALRGSQVFIDRPRVVIGMFREGPHTIVGLGKCNIPPHLGMVTHERVFRRDPKKLQLVQLEGEAGIRGEFMSPEEIEALKEMGQI